MTRVPLAYRVLVRLLPPAFRARHQDDLLRTLDDQLEGLRGPARVRAWIGACLDTARVAAAIRWTDRQPPDDGVHDWRTVMGGFWQDIVFAARSLRRRPAAAIVPILTLAVGIGATTTVFSIVHGVLLRPLPYTDAERIGILWHEFGHGAQNLPALHPLDLYDYRDRSEVFERFTLATGRRLVLGGHPAPQLVDVGFVEAGFFEFFGAAPALGRFFTPADDRPGAATAAVLSDRLWRQRFGGDPAVLDRLVDVQGRAVRIVGVLPPAFRLHLPEEAFLLRDAEIWVPAAVDRTRLPPRNFTGYTGFARLRPGATFAEGQQELEALAATLRDEHTVHASSALQTRIVPLHDDVVKGARERLVFLQAAVGFVLLIVCANVANLLLVRGRQRANELAVRSALGARGTRLVRLVFVESALLALAGGGAGVVLAAGGVRVVAAMGEQHVPLVGSAAIDPTVLLFALGVSALSALVFGAAPAMQALDGRRTGWLSGSGRTTASRGSARLRDALVTAEIALGLVLLVGAGLMIQSFARLSAVDPGYTIRDVVTFTLSLSGSESTDAEARAALHTALTERLGALPGVTAVAGVSHLPLTGSGPLQPYAYDARTAENWESVTADERRVTPGFFDAIGATLIAGRDFTEAEARQDVPVIIVDDRLAARAFPGENAVGRRLQIEPNGTPEDERYAEIVGVVRHLRLHDLSRPHLTQIYFPSWGAGHQSYVVRTATGTTGLGEAIRREVAELSATAAVDELQTLQALAHEALAPARFGLTLMLGFGATALLLAALGIYGVLASSVQQRAREIGLRVALGQSPAGARLLVLRHGARLVALALAVGLAASAILASGVSSLFFGVDPLDPAIYAFASATLLATALVACWIPAVAATRVDPVLALRSE